MYTSRLATEEDKLVFCNECEYLRRSLVSLFMLDGYYICTLPSNRTRRPYNWWLLRKKLNRYGGRYLPGDLN